MVKYDGQRTLAFCLNPNSGTLSTLIGYEGGLNHVTY